MTATDKENIRQLRGGLGYKVIAVKLELPVASVKGFCQRNNLGAVADSQDTADSCLQCGAALGERLPGAERKKFCSDACRYKWWSHNTETRMPQEKDKRLCAHCNRVFYSRKPKKYCNHGCYIIARFGRKRHDN
jgi:hypothetical protein